MRVLDQGNIANNDKGKENDKRYYRGRNLTSKDCLTV